MDGPGPNLLGFFPFFFNFFLKKRPKDTLDWPVDNPVDCLSEFQPELGWANLDRPDRSLGLGELALAQPRE